MKPAFAFIGLFITSVIGIVLGYSDAATLLDRWQWERVISAIPVVPAALAISIGCPTVCLLAFWLCRGDRHAYNNAVTGYSYISPFLIVLLLLPGEQSKPGWASLNLYTMLTILCAAQVIAVRTVRDWFWSKGSLDASITQ